MKTLFGLLISLLVCLTAFPVWAIDYVGSRIVSTAGTTSAWNAGINGGLTGGIDDHASAGDLVVATYCVGGFATADKTLSIKNSSAVDYTLIGSEQFANDSNTTNLRMAYRVMPSPVETELVLSETVNGGTGAVTDSGIVHIFVLRNVHATPLEQAAVQNTAINTRIINPGDITPLATTTFTLVAGCGAGAAGGTYTSSDLTDFKAGTVVDSTDISIGAGYLTGTTSPLSPATFGGGGSDTISDSYAVTIAAFATVAVAASAAGPTGCGAALILLGKGAGC